MQKKDFDKINSSSKLDLKKSLRNKKIVANIVEFEDEIFGWVFYELLSKKIKLKKIAFSSEKILNFILENLLKKNKIIEISISEYDLKMQLALKNYNFLFIESIKSGDIYYYKFRKETDSKEPS
jgi:hypothetical protein